MLTPVPCSRFPRQDTAECPGYLNNKHCTACHQVYSGYVALCPIHSAALRFAEWLEDEAWTLLTDAEVLAQGAIDQQAKEREAP